MKRITQALGVVWVSAFFFAPTLSAEPYSALMRDPGGTSADYHGWGSYGGDYLPPGSQATAMPPPELGGADHFVAGAEACEGVMVGGEMGLGWCRGGVGIGWRRREYEMPMHYPYYPPLHGYYYFHPYHPSHVAAHQAFVARFGVDPRNPYCNDFFRTIYAEYRASQHERVGEVVRVPPVR